MICYVHVSLFEVKRCLNMLKHVSFISVKKQFVICGKENGKQNLDAKCTKLNP